MTTYNSYEAAKIAMPDACIIEDTDSGLFFGMPGREGATLAVGSRFAEPQYYCMTVERFLADGHKFVEGDKILTCKNNVFTMGECGVHCENFNIKHENNDRTFILRAAALEERAETESEYDKGMREAMQKVAVSCGRVFGADVGYEDLPDLVDGLINPPKKKPRTKVEYVKVDISDVGFSDIADLFFMESDGNFVEIGDIDAAKLIADKWKLHRRIETPMTWKEELYDYLDSSCEMSDDFDDSFTIEIEGRPLEFNLNDDEFVDMCKLVASLNSVN